MFFRTRPDQGKVAHPNKSIYALWGLASTGDAMLRVKAVEASNA